MKYTDLVDIAELQSLCESFSAGTGISTAIIDLQGKVLAASQWQDICTRFHRLHPLATERCIESDTVLATLGDDQHNYTVYQCRNGLIDAAVPIIIEGEHVANFFAGQLLFEPPDKEYFARQAEEYGFDKAAYLDALDKVPVVSREHLEQLMDFLARLARLMGEWGLVRKRLEREIQQHREDEVALRQSKDQLRLLTETLEQRVAERTALAEHRAGQLRLLAAELTQAEERERHRLASFLHDHLQQVLVAARMKASLLSRRVGEEQSLAILAQVDDLLDQAIGESRSLTADLSPPVLYDRGLVGGLQWLVRQAEEKYQLPVGLRAEPNAEPAELDIRVLLFQAARELLLNVAKHAQAGRAEVELACCKDGRLWLIVADDGIGFDPADLERQEKKSGFGLFSIRERLELIGGQLQLQSVPGKGTRARIEVPLPSPLPTPRPRQQPTAPPPAVAALRRPGKTRVLLVDDHTILRRGLAGLLRGHPTIDVVDEAADGQQAVDLALATHPDVIVMDISMPGMSGIEATRRIVEVLPDTRVIGLSMHEADDMAHAMLKAGAVAYVRKDAGADIVLETILHHAACCEAI